MGGDEQASIRSIALAVLKLELDSDPGKVNLGGIVLVAVVDVLVFAVGVAGAAVELIFGDHEAHYGILLLAVIVLALTLFGCMGFLVWDRKASR